MDQAPGSRSASFEGVLCPVIKCPECGDRGLLVRRERGFRTIACTSCASVTVRAEPQRDQLAPAAGRWPQAYWPQA